MGKTNFFLAAIMSASIAPAHAAQQAPAGAQPAPASTVQPVLPSASHGIMLEELWPTTGQGWMKLDRDVNHSHRSC